jgi:hypothetical protein
LAGQYLSVRRRLQEVLDFLIALGKPLRRVLCARRFGLQLARTFLERGDLLVLGHGARHQLLLVFP